MKFFFSSMRLQIFFFGLQHSAIFFFCVDGVEKVGIPLLLVGRLAAVLFNSNRGSIVVFIQFNLDSWYQVMPGYEHHPVQRQ